MRPALDVFPTDSLIWWAFCLILVFAMIWDVRFFRIPNELVLVLVALGAAMLLMESPELAPDHVMIGGGSFVIGYLLFRFAAMGAGDAKLVAAVLFWSGPTGLLAFLYWLLIGMIALLILLALGRVIYARYRAPGAGWEAYQKDGPVPLALAIGPAAIIASSSFPDQLWAVFS